MRCWGLGRVALLACAWAVLSCCKLGACCSRSLLQEGHQVHQNERKVVEDGIQPSQQCCAYQVV